MFIRTTAEEYRGDNKIEHLDAPYAALVAALGEPHKNGEPNYPDDDYKTDVCWGIRDAEFPGRQLAIWNYKNGPSYNKGVGLTLDDIGYFSVWHNSPALFDEVMAAINAARSHA